jgi:hypothetical protein
MRLALCVMALLLANAGLFASEGATYLRLANSARAAGLGGCYSMQEADVETMWYNPAGIAGSKRSQAMFTHMSWAGDINTDALLASMPLRENQTLGLLFHRNATKDTYRDMQGNEQGEFAIAETVIGAAYAMEGEYLSFGGSLKGIYETLELANSAGLVGDAGVIGHILNHRFLGGLSLQNMGWIPNLGAVTPPTAPMTLRMGIAEQAGADAWLFQEYRVHLGNPAGVLAVGGEYRLILGPVISSIRAGYDLQHAALGGAAGLSLGLGAAFTGAQVDYAYSPLEMAGAGHRISLKVSFDAP